MDGLHPSSIHHPSHEEKSTLRMEDRRKEEEERQDPYEGTIDLHLNLPVSLVKKIDEIKRIRKLRLKHRTDVVRELLEVGMLVFTNWHNLQDPAIVEELRNQFLEGGLVDFAQHMTNRDFEACFAIFEAERKARYKLK